MSEPTKKTPEQNKVLWDKAFKTDPGHVKPITGKTYQGNSPKPYWIIQRATEIFGPCGIGWGFTVSNERFEQWGETDVAHACLVTVWYKWEGERGEVCQMGQTKAAYKTAAGKFLVDEDAAKKSVTDGMVKALSMLGFAGDIFSGRWDDSKYQDELRQDAADKRKAAGDNTQQPPAAGNQTTTRKPPTQPSNQTIGDAEFKTLVELLDETGADKQAFCKACKITSVAALPLAGFAHAVGKLQEKRKAQLSQPAPDGYNPLQDSANQSVEFE
jgi:hypothetical protein